MRHQHWLSLALMLSLGACGDSTPNNNTTPGTDAGAHGYKYVRRGHQGPHCGFGVSPAVFASGVDLGGAGGTCVMFGEAGAASPSSFCLRCAPFVNAQDLSTIV